VRRAIQAVKPFLPVTLKRRLIRAVPPRFYRLVDPDWHRRAVGGRWEELGRLQFDYVRSGGLEPQHYFLDLGCGSLRGGVHFIRYLEPGHYFGIDKNPERLEAGRRVELPRYRLEHKRPVLEVIDDFQVARLGQDFDYALAQSVFTHLSLELVGLCIRNVARALAPGGRFYATFLEGGSGSTDVVDRSHLAFEKDPIYRHDPAALRLLAEEAGLSAQHVSDWGHPRGQAMLVLSAPPS
jgi:SAM-dependent methyltransferase